MARVSVLRSAFHLASGWQAPLTTRTSSGSNSTSLTEPVRHLNIFTLFNKEAREKERLRLKDEMNRGYFDDLRDLKRTGGKVAIASQNLVPVSAAGKFPRLTGSTKNGECISLPFESESTSGSMKRATLVCMAFRASAQSMIESWIKPFLDNFQSSASVKLVQVSVVESWFLSLWPIKNALLQSMHVPALAEGERPLERTMVYAFGDTYYFRKELGISNVLTGYLFLLDNRGRVRWRASGLATCEELSSMISCTSRLLEETSLQGFQNSTEGH